MFHTKTIIEGINAINEGKTDDYDWERLARALLTHVAYVEGSLESVSSRIADAIDHVDNGYVAPLEHAQEQIKNIRLTERK